MQDGGRLSGSLAQLWSRGQRALNPLAGLGVVLLACPAEGQQLEGLAD